MYRSKKTCELSPLKLWCKLTNQQADEKGINFYLGCEKSKDNPNIFYGIQRATYIVEKLNRKGFVHRAYLYRNNIEGRPLLATYNTYREHWEYAEHQSKHVENPKGYSPYDDDLAELEEVIRKVEEFLADSKKQIDFIL
jgi:hypothetical protein